MIATVALPAFAQSRLGDLRPGDLLRLPLTEVVPVSRLRVEIDGVPVQTTLTIEGSYLLVALPEGLSGHDHDIVLLRLQPGDDLQLGSWTFGLLTGQTEMVMTGVVEIERREGATGGETLYAGSGRIGFDVDGGRFRGGIGFVQSDSTTRGRGATEATDYFLESRGSAFGQDLIFRIGTQSLPSETLLAEDADWRGMSLRLVDPEGRADVMGFVLRPGEGSGLRNLTGIEDRDDRLVGVAGYGFPLTNAGLRSDILAYSGRATLPDGAAGRAEGAGLRLSGPLGQDWGDFALGYARTETRSPSETTPRIASAWQAEAGIGLLPQSAGGGLEFRLTGSQTDADFFSPLNPDLISDERRVEAALLYQSDEWQVKLAADRARSNIGNASALPTDRVRDLSLDVSFSPYVFTGGFLNGVTFYGSVYSEDQRRLFTPSGGPAPDDFRLKGVSLGMDRFQPDHSWAVGLSLDWLEDMSGAGESERRQRIEAAYAYTPDDLTTLTLNAEAGRSINSAGIIRDATLEAGFAFPLIPERWSAYVEAGTVRSSIAKRSGAYFGGEIERSLTPSTSFFIRADYAEGAKADPLSPRGGWVFGLALRHEFGSGQ